MNSKIQKILVTTILTLTSSTSFALATFGLKGGAGFTSYATKPTATDVDQQLGYIGGVSVDVGAGLAGVVIDVLYANRTYDSTESVGMLTIPAQLKLTLVPMFFASFGGYYAMAVTNKDALTNSNLKTSDFGAVAGLGVSIPAGFTTLTLEGRYSYGIADTLDDTNSLSSTRNRHIDFLVGVQF